ncbi:hypothetical protein FIBSPDRAFT_137819 [Athelia psychrophila]|uniref:Uncharacterized protein n=1 Tax=Athelia psychrophila TaxID=1759441 RepID=A0A166C255_9AGAM|nr:hypothetical protein FIBSPDRAFT_137819 [Fibularhizoctonia sp. CBS 109695]
MDRTSCRSASRAREHQSAPPTAPTVYDGGCMSGRLNLHQPFIRVGCALDFARIPTDPQIFTGSPHVLACRQSQLHGADRKRANRTAQPESITSRAEVGAAGARQARLRLAASTTIDISTRTGAGDGIPWPQIISWCSVHCDCDVHCRDTP